MRQCSPGTLSRQLTVYRQRVVEEPSQLDRGLLSHDHVSQALTEANVVWRERAFSPLVTLWTFLLQVLSSDGSCREAVTRVRALREVRIFSVRCCGV
jgi:hypothetical protein